MNTNQSVEICGVKGIHHDVVGVVRSQMPGKEGLSELAGLFKLFGDSTRLSILWALSESEMCVCDLCALLHLKQPTVSHQLKNLKLSRVVKSRREGQVIYYSLEDEHIRKLLDMGMKHVREL